MALKVPNYDQATYPPQSALDTADIGAIVAGIGRTGVLSGCAVTQRGAGANMSVDVAAGTVEVSGLAAAVTATNKVVGAADATNPRIDLVVASTAGALSVIAGTAAVSPEAPETFDPATQVLLAAVYVPANATTVATAQIVDKRILTPDPASMGFIGGVSPLTGWYQAPPGQLSSLAPAANLLTASPMPVPVGCTLLRIGVNVTVAVAASTIRLGIYADDGTGHPGALLLDAGTVSSATTGFKEIAISQAVPAGLIWLAQVSQGGAPTSAFSSAGQQGLTSNSASDVYGGGPVVGYTSPTSTPGALPAAFGTAGARYNGPRIVVRP